MCGERHCAHGTKPASPLWCVVLSTVSSRARTKKVGPQFCRSVAAAARELPPRRSWLAPLPAPAGWALQDLRSTAHLGTRAGASEGVAAVICCSRPSRRSSQLLATERDLRGGRSIADSGSVTRHLVALSRPRDSRARHARLCEVTRCRPVPWATVPAPRAAPPVRGWVALPPPGPQTAMGGRRPQSGSRSPARCAAKSWLSARVPG